METSKKNSKSVWYWHKIWAKLSPMFFHILHGEYLLKQKVVMVQTPESKFKVTIARNATSEGCYIGPKFCPICVKNGKKLFIFKNFTF